MTNLNKIFALTLLAACASTGAQAGNYYDSGSYNGYGASNMNAASNYSLRDANGNLTVVDGQFVPSNYSSTSGQSSSVSGVGTSGAGAAYGQASAIGNSLNVVTVGSNNTVIIDSKQTNTGNQTASVQLNGN